MLVLAPAACILSGIALSEIFGLLTRSLKVVISPEAPAAAPGAPEVSRALKDCCYCVLAGRCTGFRYLRPGGALTGCCDC